MTARWQAVGGEQGSVALACCGICPVDGVLVCGCGSLLLLLLFQVLNKLAPLGGLPTTMEEGRSR